MYFVRGKSEIMPVPNSIPSRGSVVNVFSRFCVLGSFCVWVLVFESFMVGSFMVGSLLL